MDSHMLVNGLTVPAARLAMNVAMEERRAPLGSRARRIRGPMGSGRGLVGGIPPVGREENRFRPRFFTRRDKLRKLIRRHF